MGEVAEGLRVPPGPPPTPISYHGAVIVKDQPTILWQTLNFVGFKEQPKLGHPSAIITAVPRIHINLTFNVLLTVHHAMILGNCPT